MSRHSRSLTPLYLWHFSPPQCSQPNLGGTLRSPSSIRSKSCTTPRGFNSSSTMLVITNEPLLPHFATLTMLVITNEPLHLHFATLTMLVITNEPLLPHFATLTMLVIAKLTAPLIFSTPSMYSRCSRIISTSTWRKGRRLITIIRSSLAMNY
jgi:hypothetical protein